jgi:acetyltransferase
VTVTPDGAPRLVRALGDLWLAVTRAGGAVGHTADEPEAHVRADAAAAVAEVVAGRQHLITADGTAAGDLDGVVFLRPGSGPRVAHRADVLRLMVHPSARGRGLGRRLLDAAADRARALGLEQLLLSARGGTSLPEFYAGLGWTEVGRFPAALHLGGDDRRDEHWFQLRLTTV